MMMAEAVAADASFQHQLERVFDHSTRAYTHLHYTLHGGVLGEWLRQLLLGTAFQDRLNAVVAALKEYFEGQARKDN